MKAQMLVQWFVLSLSVSVDVRLQLQLCSYSPYHTPRFPFPF
jgi:hypothetical protein